MAWHIADMEMEYQGISDYTSLADVNPGQPMSDHRKPMLGFGEVPYMPLISQTGSASRLINRYPDHRLSNSQRPSSTQIDHRVKQGLSESRSVRVVLYSSTPAESDHRFWIDPEATFRGFVNALAEIYPSQESMVLQANWGPRPYWTASYPDSLIGSTCRVLYAILKDQAKPFTLGVVRTSLSDYPIPIYLPAAESSMTLLEAVIASYPKLTGQVKSIVLHPGDQDIQDALWNDEFIESRLPPTAPLFITTLDEPLKEFLVGSLYESFSPSFPKASTSSDSDGLIPPFLQISFVECKLLVQRAYELNVFPLQMIHLSRAILHLVISLAKSVTSVFDNTSSSIEEVLSTEDDLSDHLRVAPLLCRQLEELLDAANAILDDLESDSFNREGAQHTIKRLFVTLCGDLPGAITVRYSDKAFKKFGSIDYEELDTLALDTLDVKNARTGRYELITEDREMENLDSVMGPDHHRSDVGKPISLNRAPRCSEANQPMAHRREQCKWDLCYAPVHLRHPLSLLLSIVAQSPFVSQDDLEPKIGSELADSILLEVHKKTGVWLGDEANDGESIYILFIDQNSDQSLVCAHSARTPDRTIGHLRSMLDQRPFACLGRPHCNSKKCNSGDRPMQFFTEALREDHMRRQPLKDECTTCGAMIRRGGMNRHARLIHHEALSTFVAGDELIDWRPVS